MQHCDQCGAMNEDNRNFCAMCGSSLPQVIKPPARPICQNCGNQNQAGAKFCEACGGAMATGELDFTGIPAPKPKKRPMKVAIALVAVILLIMGSYIGIPKLLEQFGSDSELAESQVKAAIDEVTGEFYSGRAITIHGQGFGLFDSDVSSVKIDGKEASILSWGDAEITLCLPEGISKGKKSVIVHNPPSVKKLTVQSEFKERQLQEIARGMAEPGVESLIETAEVKVLIPPGSLKESREIVISRYDVTVEEKTPFDSVMEEYEITDASGNHLFFEGPVFFGIKVPEEEAYSTGMRYFDNSLGVWVLADTAYNPEDGRLYVKTTHFSGWQRFTTHIQKKIGQKIDAGVESAKKIVDYTYNAGKSAVNTVIELAEESYVLTNDALLEEFAGIGGEHVIVFYRVSDFKNDNNIRDKALEAAAAYDTAYRAYRNLFGDQGVPNYNYITRLEIKEKGFFESFLQPRRTEFGSHLIETEETHEDARLKVFIDPRYNVSGANYNLLTGTVSMPSTYPGKDLAVTCAHELFHSVQHHQLGLKMLYMANGYKEMGARLEKDPQVTRYQANNKWFFEATAEFAALFIGTQKGIPVLHSGIEASSPYYAFSGRADGQEYAMAAFIDYIASERNHNYANRGNGFRQMWDTVLRDYSMAASVNLPLDSYVYQQLGTSAVGLYGEFWRDIVTQSAMPAFPQGRNTAGTAAATGMIDFLSLQRAKGQAIKNNGVGVYRMAINDKSLPQDLTASLRSVWIDMSNQTLAGDIYQLPGMAPDDRLDQKIKPIAYVNRGDSVLKEVLIPFREGDNFALAALFQNFGQTGDPNIVKCMVTQVLWDNQSEIASKARNTTLAFDDQLQFTVTLPKLRTGDAPFTGRVILNDSTDFIREIDRIENGKPFTVDPPMFKDSALPPAEVAAQVEIFQDGELLHIYKSPEPEDNDLNLNLALQSGTLEEKSSIVLAVQGVPADTQVTRYRWQVKTSPKGLLKEKLESSTGEINLDFSKAMTFEVTVNVYGTVDGKESILGTTAGKYTVAEAKKQAPASSKIEGKWRGIERSWGGGGGLDPIKVTDDQFSLSCGSGTFSLTISNSNGSWTFIGDYKPTEENKYEMKLNSGDKTKDYQDKQNLLVFSLESLDVYISPENGELSLGGGDTVIFVRE